MKITDKNGKTLKEGGKVLKFDSVASAADWLFREGASYKRFSFFDLNGERIQIVEGNRKPSMKIAIECAKAFKAEKPKEIDLEVMEWFDRTYGNSYYSAQMTVDGIKICLPMSYGGKEMALQDAKEVLGMKGHLERVCREGEIALYVNSCECKYRDTLAFGKGN